MAHIQSNPPIFKTPYTDFSAILGILDIQVSGRELCRKMEMSYFNCLEAYGIEKGYEKCQPYYQDLMECRYGEKERARLQAIRREVEKQIKEGKRTLLPPPEADAYYEIHF